MGDANRAEERENARRANENAKAGSRTIQVWIEIQGIKREGKNGGELQENQNQEEVTEEVTEEVDAERETARGIQNTKACGCQYTDIMPRKKQESRRTKRGELQEGITRWEREKSEEKSEADEEWLEGTDTEEEQEEGERDEYITLARMNWDTGTEIDKCNAHNKVSKSTISQ